MIDRFHELSQLARSNDAAFRDISRNECLMAAREYVRASRAEIRQRHIEGESGLNVVRMLSDTADTLLRGVFDFGLYEVSNRNTLLSRVSLCALGGYGRAELSPHSDLDVCLLYDGELDANIEILNSFLIPFLWDVGFAVCYTIRSVQEAVDLAFADIKVFTCILESRLIAGDSTTFGRVKLHLREPLVRSKTASGTKKVEGATVFIRSKAKERYELLDEMYRDLYCPEPNIKENRGGLRDCHTALWLLMMAYGSISIDSVVSLGILTPEEHLDIVQGVDFIWRIRNELHFNLGREEDTLTFANQRLVASAFGYSDADGENVHLFMGDYYASARQLHRFLYIAARVCEQKTESVQPDLPFMPQRIQIVVKDGLLEAGQDDARWFAEQPARLMETLWECARRHVPLGRATELRVMDALPLITDTFRTNDLVRRFFLAICNRPLQAGHALRLAANIGILGRYLPEFGAIQGIICYEDFHHYPVDEHTLRAIEALEQAQHWEGPVAACLQKALEHLPDPYILIMGILLHDLGKANGEKHVEEGVVLARTICTRIGMPSEDMERIVFLVQHHLLMTHMSQYRDVDDSEMVRQFAETMKTEERLRMLFLLSYADMAAVGPNVWNDWKGALLLKLYLRAEMILLGRADVIGEEYWKAPKVDEVRALLSPELSEDVEEHVKGLGDRYLIAYSPRHIAMHVECVTQARKKGYALHRETHTPTGTTEIVICTRDRHGLFSQIAGSFTSQLLDVSNAALFTRPDGWVVDCFTVSDVRRGKPISATQFKAFERVIGAVLLKERNVQEFVERSRSHLFALLQPRIPVQTRVMFDNDSSRTHSVIDIETGDRTGLLYDITRAMANAGLNIATARIVTDVRRVRDSFYVTLDGWKITEESTQTSIREAIMQAIHPRSLTETKGEVHEQT